VVASSDSCEPTVKDTIVTGLNFDDVPNSSTIDTFESDIEVWTRTGQEAIWTREAEQTGNHVWHGVDFPAPSDTALESSDIQVTATESFVMTFKERHSFE